MCSRPRSRSILLKRKNFAHFRKGFSVSIPLIRNTATIEVFCGLDRARIRNVLRNMFRFADSVISGNA